MCIFKGIVRYRTEKYNYGGHFGIPYFEKKSKKSIIQKLKKNDGPRKPEARPWLQSIQEPIKDYLAALFATFLAVVLVDFLAVAFFAVAFTVFVSDFFATTLAASLVGAA